MKKNAIVLGFLATLIVLTGCTSFNTSDGASLVPQITTDHPGYEALLSVQNTRIQGSATINVLFGFLAWGATGYADDTRLSLVSPVSLPIPLPMPLPMPELPNPEELAKKASVYNVCIGKKADTLVGSRYTIRTVDYLIFKTVTCTVEGFPAQITGVAQKKPYITPNGNLVWSAKQPLVLQ